MTSAPPLQVQPPPAPALPGPSPADAELAACKDKHLRLLADFDNFRKRQTREREDYARRSTEALIQELLPVLDHLELALANAPDKDAPLTAGVRMIADQFLAALARFDLKPFQALGEAFDPARHEAVSELPSAEVPAHHVLHQLRCGYLLGGRLLRPARVVISSGQAQTAAPATPDAVMLDMSRSLHIYAFLPTRHIDPGDMRLNVAERRQAERAASCVAAARGDAAQRPRRATDQACPDRRRPPGPVPTVRPIVSMRPERQPRHISAVSLTHALSG